MRRKFHVRFLGGGMGAIPSCYPTLGKVFEKSADVAGLQVARMTFVVKQDQAARSLGMAFGRPVLSETVQRDLTDEVEQPRRLGRRHGVKRLTGHGLLPVDSGLWVSVPPDSSVDRKKIALGA